MTGSTRKSRGFTLVELLVVIAIIGILMAILLPAVQAAREAGRRTICKNNLSNIGKAALQHLEMHGHFPSSGWGGEWTGDPDRGVGMKQPGGWIYNVLPFMGEDQVHQLRDLSKQRAHIISIFNCPSRRTGVRIPPGPGSTCNNAETTTMFLARTDYAANGGTVIVVGTGLSENCYTRGIKDESCQHGVFAGMYEENEQTGRTEGFTGVSGALSQISDARGHMPDGTTHTYFAGEKYLDPNTYETGVDPSDNNSMYHGHSANVIRWAGGEDLRPHQDSPGFNPGSHRFGSAHSAGFHVVMCDGSAHMLQYSIEADIHGYLADRHDEATFGDDEWLP